MISRHKRTLFPSKCKKNAGLLWNSSHGELLESSPGSSVHNPQASSTMQRSVTEWLNISKLLSLSTNSRPETFLLVSDQEREDSWSTVSETSCSTPCINHCYFPHQLLLFSLSIAFHFLQNGAQKGRLRMGKKRWTYGWRCSSDVLDGDAVDSCGDSSPAKETWRKL